MNRKILATSGKLIVSVMEEIQIVGEKIIVEKSEHDRSLKCRAVSVGDTYTRPNGVDKVRPPCKDGDIVYIRKPSRKPDFRMDGKDYYSIPFIEVLFVRRDCVVC